MRFNRYDGMNVSDDELNNTAKHLEEMLLPTIHLPEQPRQSMQTLLHVLEE